jgi:hypothetical protein
MRCAPRTGLACGARVALASLAMGALAGCSPLLWGASSFGGILLVPLLQPPGPVTPLRWTTVHCQTAGSDALVAAHRYQTHPNSAPEACARLLGPGARPVTRAEFDVALATRPRDSLACVPRGGGSMRALVALGPAPITPGAAFTQAWLAPYCSAAEDQIALDVYAALVDDLATLDGPALNIRRAPRQR